MKMAPANLCIIALITALFAGFISSCGSSQKNAGQNTPDAPEPVLADANRDTIPDGPPPPPPGPAPDHVKLKGILLDITDPAGDDNGKGATIRLIVHSVEAYGSSTPPVAVSDTLKIHASRSMSRDIQNLIGKIVPAMISYRQVPLSGSDVPSWYLVDINSGNR